MPKKLADYVATEMARRAELADLQEYLAGTRDGMFGLNGKNWLGPMLPPTDPKFQFTLEAIKRSYLVQNLVKKIVINHVAAITGKEVDWTIFEGEERELVEEAMWLKDWFYQQQVQLTLTDALHYLMYAALDESSKTSSLLRFYIPERAVAAGVGLGGVNEALLLGVRLMEIAPDQGGMIRDGDNETVGGFYLWRDEDENKDYIELTMLVSDMQRLEIDTAAEYDDPYLTVVQIRSGTTYDEIIDEAAYPLNRELTIYEMTRDSLLTPDMYSQQNGLNTEWTFLNRHAGASAFLERVILNGMPPGEWVDPETGKADPEGTQYVVGEMNYGAGTTNFVQGVETRDARGEIVGRSNASVQWKDPSSSESILNNIAAHRYALYDAANQLHKLIAGDAVASGVARQQALQDFVLSLLPTENQLNFALRWLLMTALRLASYMSGEPARYVNVSADPSVEVYVSDPLPDELRLFIEQHIAGVFDRAELMRRSGIKDVAQMIERVEKEMKEKADEAVRQAAALAAQEQINAMDGNKEGQSSGNPAQQGAAAAA